MGAWGENDKYGPGAWARTCAAAPSPRMPTWLGARRSRSKGARPEVVGRMIHIRRVTDTAIGKCVDGRINEAAGSQNAITS